MIDIKPSPGPTFMGKGGGARAGFSHFSPRPCFTPLASWEAEVYSGAFSDMCRCKSVLFQESPANRPPLPPPKKGEKGENRKDYISCSDNMPLRTFTKPCRRDPSACCWSVSGDGNRPLLQARAPSTAAHKSWPALQAVTDDLLYNRSVSTPSPPLIMTNR